MNPPEHPGNPKWQTFEEWNQIRQPSSILVEPEKESEQDLLARFGLQEESGTGWGDASEAQDAGWGLPSQNTGGW